MTRAVRTAVLGSGAVALAHALFQARHGPVVLAGQQLSAVASVERVPAPLLTLLLELGIAPAELDVDRLSRRSLVAWEGSLPAERVGPACAHVDRRALVEVLWRRARACGDIHVAPPVTGGSRRGPATLAGSGWRANRVADATGRRALTARRRLHPTPVWIAASSTVQRRDRDATMRLAAGPAGYAYRLGSARLLTVGWVGPGRPPVDGESLAERVSENGAGWILDDVDLRGAPAVRRAASVAVALRDTDPRVVAIGDAALARDALASQGTAIGLSDARTAAVAELCEGDPDVMGRRLEDSLERHLRHLSALLRTCGHRRAPAWLVYRRWVEERRLASEGALGPAVRGPVAWASGS